MNYEDVWVDKLTEVIGINLQRNEYEAIKNYSSEKQTTMSKAIRELIFLRIKNPTLKGLYIEDDDLRVGVYKHFRISFTKSQYDEFIAYCDSNDLSTANAFRLLIFENPILKKRGRKNHNRTHRLMINLSNAEYMNLKKRFGNYQMAEGIRRALFK